MGLFSSNSAPVQLQPFSPPLGVHTAFCVPNPTTLVLKEKAFSWSGDDFQVKDANGVEVIRVKGKTLGFGDKKAVYDTQGNHLLTLRTKLIAIHKTFIAERPDGTEIFTVKSKFARTCITSSLPSPSRHPRTYEPTPTRTVLGSKMVATFRNASDGQEIELSCRGSILEGSADIALGDRPVAQLTRKLFNAREFFADKQTYFVTVAPGVDLVLIAAIAICFDEKEHEGN